MALSSEDKQEIRELFASHYQTVCMCGLSTEARNEMSHFMGMVRDIGEGDHARGIEDMRENIKYFSRFRRRGEKIGLAIVSFVSISVVGAAIYLIREGVKAIITKGP